MVPDGREARSSDPEPENSDGPNRGPGSRAPEQTARLLLVVHSETNRDKLASWLSKSYAVETLGDRPISEALERCDLCLIDGASIPKYRSELAAGKVAAQPLFLPYLLILSDLSPSDIGAAGWEAVDDVIETPIRQSELQGRIQALLRARHYSEDLKQQNERLEEFANIVSHDLRNPLSIASGFLESGRKQNNPEHLDRVDAALDRMEDIISDVLTLARSGSVVTETESVDPVTVAESAWETVSTARATLEVDTEKQVTVQADRSRLVELFENLFRNAVEHVEDRPLIRVGPLADGVGFYVADDGPGIPPGDREAVFEYGHTSDDGGTGFGLSIVRSIVDAHDWSIRVAESESGGARFEIVCERSEAAGDATDRERMDGSKP